MPATFRSTTNPFKILQTIHTAMLAGMVLFGVISAVVHLSLKTAADPFFNKVLQVTALAVSFIFIKLGLTIFDRKLQALSPVATATEKMAVYKVASIIKWAMIEIPVLFAVVCFMLTRNYAFIALAFALIIFFAFQGAAKLKVMLQLQLTEQEAADLELQS